MLFRNVAIESVAYDLAPHRITSEWLEDQIAETMERLSVPRGRLVDLSGIHERRLWDPGTRPSTVATIAAQKAIEAAEIDPQEIGCLINTSVFHDYLEPSTAVFIHRNLNLSPACTNYDVRNACLGFVNGMTIAAMMIELGAIKYGLVVSGETIQDGIMATVERLKSADATPQEFRESFASLTLGCGAVAMVLSRADESRTSHRINGAVTRAATEHNELCIGQPTWMKTDASGLLVAGVKLATETWQMAAETLPNWSDDQIALYAPHQVGSRHMAAVAQALGITSNKLHLNFPTQGNMASAAVPITLAQAAEVGRIKAGDQVALLGIGSGLNCSMMSVTW
ncbi:MAG: 3-oxoacyl-ACP synthase III [Chloroflexaceae bacterium]|jgi:3-oxoacyl-[acyl-carrier-protein] synthase-3|nr:3-oxoacyl-ACP synthase III [Chloroflexaceae bacterium]